MRCSEINLPGQHTNHKNAFGNGGGDLPLGSQLREQEVQAEGEKKAQCVKCLRYPYEGTRHENTVLRGQGQNHWGLPGQQPQVSTREPVSKNMDRS